MVKFSDLEDAFLFVSLPPYGEHSAYLNKDSGEIKYQSEMGGIEEMTDEEVEGDEWLDIPADGCQSRECRSHFIF